MWHLCLEFDREDWDCLKWAECRYKNFEKKSPDNKQIKRIIQKISDICSIFSFSLFFYGMFSHSPKSVSFQAPQSQSGQSAGDDDKPEALTSNNVIHLLQGSLQHVAGIRRHWNQTGTSQTVDELAKRGGQMRYFPAECGRRLPFLLPLGSFYTQEL